MGGGGSGEAAGRRPSKLDLAFCMRGVRLVNSDLVSCMRGVTILALY